MSIYLSLYQKVQSDKKEWGRDEKQLNSAWAANALQPDSGSSEGPVLELQESPPNPDKFPLFSKASMRWFLSPKIIN